jgi:hypothetical protein
VPEQEQITRVEERYLELASPTEFDGIRTQIAKEFSIPKKAVKKIIKDLRDRQHIPSWWEMQTYKGSQEEMDRIKAVYQPMLPIPSVGVHKQIAQELSLKPGIVYQAIKAIRLELNLPQYNDPSLHEGSESANGQHQPAGDQANSESAPVDAVPATPAPELISAEEPIASTPDNKQETE